MLPTLVIISIHIEKDLSPAFLNTQHYLLQIETPIMSKSGENIRLSGSLTGSRFYSKDERKHDMLSIRRVFSTQTITRRKIVEKKSGLGVKVTRVCGEHYTGLLLSPLFHCDFHLGPPRKHRARGEASDS